MASQGASFGQLWLANMGRLTAMDEIDRALAAVNRSEQRLHRDRAALHDAIREGLKAQRQVDIARRVGYSREYIRRIARGEVR